MKRKKGTLVISILAVILISLTSFGCLDESVLVEISRCLFINYKIDYAIDKLDYLDAQMALAYDYPVFEIEKKIYSFTENNGRVLKTLVWYPKNKTDKSPVVLFSHGFSNSGESQLYLLKGLARRGNIVIAPDHLDIVNFDHIGLFDKQKNSTLSSTDLIGVIDYVILNMIRNEAANYIRYFNLSEEEIEFLADSGELFNRFNILFNYRINDINFLLEKLTELNASDATFKGKIDFNRLVLGGHSLGGYAVIKRVFTQHPFKALFCLSPDLEPFNQNDLAKINVPVLYMTGDLDHFHDDIAWAFDNTAVPKVFQSILDGGHNIFTDRPFLYGLGIPFISGGETGFTDNLPFDKERGNSNYCYPEQLKDYQGKALTILKSVSAFVDFYVSGNENGLEILNDMQNDYFISQEIIEE
ncbi:MAG: hypothetical protein Q7K65_05580 [Candidatus Buchananbacteria bacterium]|nr:hypothetical protein [Candidatus Buchananbacteria bacterium]